jgi:hypothetical protein
MNGDIVNLADAAAQALARHVPGTSGVCLGCLKLFRKPIAYPCRLVQLAELAIKITRGEGIE